MIVLLAAAAVSEPVWAPAAPWPWSLADDAREALVCPVEVGVDGRGRPVDPVAVGCSEEIGRRAERRVRSWRWPRGAADEPRRVVEVVWPAAGDTDPFPVPQRWWWRQGVSCEARLTSGYREVGAVRVDRVSPGCSLEVAMSEPPPLAGPRRPMLCAVTFVATDGLAGPVELFRCPPATWERVEAWVRGGEWRSPWPSTGWSVWVRVDR